MAKKKKAKSKVARRKKGKKTVVISISGALILAVSLCVALIFALKDKTNDSSTSESRSSSTSSSDTSLGPTESDEISFHFIEEDLQNSGDVIYVKAGDNDILIDGGAKKAVAATAKKYIDDYVTDGKFEYVFVTHAHEDHLSGLVGKSLSNGSRDGLLYTYKVDNIIDFSYFMSSKVTVDNSYAHTLSEDETNKSTEIYQDYLVARERLVESGSVHHIAKELTQKGSNWTVSLGKNLSVTLLYQFYYDHTRSETKSLDNSYAVSGFSDQNDCSLALLFKQGEKQFLFTGDSETYAERSIAESNPELGQVELFKAGHHGSMTANTDKLLSVIKPKAVVASCVAGNCEFNQTSKETTFPGQATIDRISVYTDRFYVTTEGSFTDKSYHTPLNGNVVFKYDKDGNETVTCSASDKILKETSWFANNRTMPEAWKSETEMAHIWIRDEEENAE